MWYLSISKMVVHVLGGLWSRTLDGPAIRANRFAENAIVITFERFARIASNLRARQRSGEGVVRRNDCPKGRFWRVRFFSAPLGLLLKRLKGPENLKGAEKRRTLQKRPFGQPFLRTTPSPLLWRTPNLTCDLQFLVPQNVYVHQGVGFF